MNLQDEMVKRIKAAMPDAEVRLKDLAGGDHWQATIVSSSFEGLMRVDRQRAVYAALGELMHGPIHALTFQALTPAQAAEQG
ncbi:MAG: BolA/IbaG family iron-sulfur metabolism protein [Bradymonadia bacterium]